MDLALGFSKQLGILSMMTSMKLSGNSILVGRSSSSRTILSFALVPKTGQATKLGDYRPIACCNVVYKIISKILATRLIPILGSLISPAQAAFIENRSMSENIYLVQELL
jgi:hypothetical protein